MGFRAFLILIVFLSGLFATQKTQKVSLQLLWKHQFEFAGFYMAKEKGFYKDVNLDVQLKEYNFGINIVSDVQKRKSTFGIGYPNIILDKANGSDIILLNAIFQSSPHVLVSLKSSGIDSIKDFKDKKVMIESNAIKAVPLISMLQANNLSKDDLTFLDESFNIQDLLDKKTDIYSAYISNEIYTLEKKGIKYNIFNPKDYGFDFYNDLLFTSKSMLDENPKIVKAFREASMLGWEYAYNNIEETIDVILKKYNTQNKTKEALIYEAKKLKELSYYKTSKVGSINKNKIQRIYDIYNLLGLTQKSIDLDNFLYESYINKINLTKQEKEFLKKNGTITVHNEKDWPPFNYNEDSMPKGFSIDYMNLLAKKLNINIKYITGPSWKEFINMSKDKKIDILLNIVKSEQREKYLEFTEPYKSLRQSIFTNLENINSLEDLNGKSIATTKSFFIEKFLKQNYPNIKINSYDNTLECLYSVIEGESDALIEDFVVIDYLSKKHNLSIDHVKLHIDKRLNFDLSIGVIKEKAILKNILQKAMNTIEQEEINTLNNKWLGINKINRAIDFTNIEKNYLKKNKITMCIDPNWMPFEKFENGKYIGISADYFKIFEKNIGKQIDVIQTKTWEESLSFAKKRKCDLLSLVMQTPNRKKYLNFTKPYLNIPLVIATKTDVTFINNLNSLKNKKVGITKGYAFVEIFKNKYPNIDIIEVDNIEDGLEKVNRGTLFGYVGTLASIGYMFQSKFTGELKIAGKFDETWSFGIGVRDDNKILLNIMKKAVDSINETQKQAILNNWLAIKYEQKVDYRFLWQVILIITILLSFFIYRQYLLNKTNKDLKQAVQEKTKELTELNKNLEIRIKKAIEENSKKDRMLFAQSKMVAMGEMIGNIAHQWRQPLSIISTAASGIKVKLEFGMFDKKEDIKNLDRLLDSTEYLSNTIDDFKNFLNPSKEKKLFNIKQTIEKNFNMFGKGFSDNNIEFILNISDIEVYGNENELLQVIINILNNSKDALIQNNKDEKFIFIDLLKTTKYVELIFTDNGGGIKEDIIHKIFDAYFTTKHKSMGTGIGLYMSYQIIRNSFNGELVASNKKYKYKNKKYTGAIFKIIIPINEFNC